MKRELFLMPRFIFRTKTMHEIGRDKDNRINVLHFQRKFPSVKSVENVIKIVGILKEYLLQSFKQKLSKGVNLNLTNPETLVLLIFSAE